MTTTRRRHRNRPEIRGEGPGCEEEEPKREAVEVKQRKSNTSLVEKSGVQFAGPLRRFYAYLVDIGLLLMLKFIIDNATGQFDLSLGRKNIYEVGILLAYFILATGIFGRTIGKWVAGVAVVDDEGNKPGVALAIPREMVGRFVATITFGIGIIWVVFDTHHRGWHDKMAGTYVVVVPNSGGPGFFARMFAPVEEDGKSGEKRRRRVGRPTVRRRRRSRRVK